MEGINKQEIHTFDFESEVKQAEDWDSLYSAIERVGIIKGTHEKKAFDVMANIDALRREAGTWPSMAFESGSISDSPLFTPITRSFGLREKVSDLIIAERKKRNKELVNDIIDNPGSVQDKIKLLSLLDEMNGIGK